MRQSFGETRTAIRANHARLSADSHERTSLPNWPGCDLVFVITPQMGAQFTQFFVHMPDGASGQAPLAGIERFLFVLEGRVTLTLAGRTHELSEEGYAFVPAGTETTLSAAGAARLVVIERRYLPLEGTHAPAPHVGNTADIAAAPMKGDDMLMLKKLMPEGTSYDFEVNTMDFSPGASLPYVETHFMEHGLLFLNGGGVYRLDDAWYPVAQGDVIWMGPFCPQWFGAIGRGNARYLIYKNWNRDPHAS